MSKKFTCAVKAVSVLLMVMVVCAMAQPAVSADMPDVSGQLSIGTASIGGAFYPFGQAVANMVSKYTNGKLVITPEVTGGAVENCRLLDNGDIDIAITNENHAYATMTGGEPFNKKMDFRAIGSFYSSILHIMVLADSPINTIQDLKGKTLGVGPAGGGTIAPMEAIMQAYDLTIQDITPSYLAYNDGFSQVADGNLDAALGLGGYPMSAVMEFSASKEIKFVNIDEEKIPAILGNSPYFRRMDIPKSVYNTTNEGVVLGISNIIMVRADMDDDVAYAITKCLFDNLEEFASINANAKETTLEGAKCSMPFHPGAQRYFDEQK